MRSRLSTGRATPGCPQLANSLWRRGGDVGTVTSVDPTVALDLCGGAARWTRLRRLGVGQHRLHAAVADGAVLLLGRGAFGLAGAPPDLVAAARLGGVASRASAARLHGWPTWTASTVPTVTIPRGSVRDLDGVTVHRANLGLADLDPRRDCTSPLRTALDCARFLAPADALCVLDAALASAAVTQRQLTEAAQCARGPGTTALRWAVAHADPRAGSPLESVLRLLLLAAGGRVRSQVWIPGVGTVDFLVDEWLVVEGDGFAFHADRVAYRTDRQRGNGLTVQGYGLLRFTWEDVRLRPLWVIAEVERVRRLRAPATAEHKANR